jgi:hypothetical protein
MAGSKISRKTAKDQFAELLQSECDKGILYLRSSAVEKTSIVVVFIRGHLGVLRFSRLSLWVSKG